MKLGFLMTPAKREVGRLVYWGLQIYDGRLYHSFTSPSESKNGNYEILLDAVTLETGCACEWHTMKRSTRAGIQEYGPVEMLHPNHLCHHLNGVSRWVRKRRKELKETRATAIEANRLLAEQARESA